MMLYTFRVPELDHHGNFWTCGFVTAPIQAAIRVGAHASGMAHSKESELGFP